MRPLCSRRLNKLVVIKEHDGHLVIALAPLFMSTYPCACNAGAVAATTADAGDTRSACISVRRLARISIFTSPPAAPLPSTCRGAFI